MGIDHGEIVPGVTQKNIFITGINVQHRPELLLCITGDPPVEQLSTNGEDAVIYANAHAIPVFTGPRIR